MDSHLFGQVGVFPDFLDYFLQKTYNKHKYT